jgi:ankyrin repeat protein
MNSLRDALLACPCEDVSTMQDYDFRTPLHFAAKNGHTEIVRFLILRGCNVNALDRWQHTPFQEAVINLQGKVVKILSQHSGGFHLQGLQMACFLNKIIMSHNMEML